jgi:Protein of unknown function (DUF2459)
MQKPARKPAERASPARERRSAARAAAVILAGAVSLVAACASTGGAGSMSSGRRPKQGDFQPTANAPPVTNFAPATLYLARRRWHMDVGFAADALRLPLAQVTREFPALRYVFFGFGDRHYLLAKNQSGPALLAALWPGAGLILVTAVSNSPQEAFGVAEVIELPLTAEQSRGIQDFIWRSLSRDATDTVAPYAPGPYEGSSYFAAVPRYSGLHTCITWAAEALRAAGFRVRSRLTLVAGQLWRQARKLRASAVPASSIAGRRVTVLADDGRAAALRDHDRGLGGWRRTAAADAASQ